ncbi:MAG: hypothetical protein GDA50_00890 [Alphaproteobacteria bacterium GM202ARS2]|nr:hypothetical protein [Alphaproteobacteria bacterium GM202ARS2]
MLTPQRVNVCLASVHLNNQSVQRQTLKGDLIWNNTRFFVNDEKEDCSWLCVFDQPHNDYMTRIPRHRLIIIVTEPKTILHHYYYCLPYFQQFGVVISPYRRPLLYRGIWHRLPPYMIWFYGYKRGLIVSDHERAQLYPRDWHDIKKEKKKTKCISVVSSDKAHSPILYQRILFINALKKELGTQLDVYNAKSNFVADKADAIDPYRYHIALENNQDKNFWTEKITDSYLGEAYPLYFGHHDIHRYFPRPSYTPINIFNIPSAIQKVKEVIASNQYEKNRHHILEAKRRVMEEHQFFPVIDRIIRSHVNTPGPTHGQEPYRPLPAPVPIRRGHQFRLFPIEKHYRRYVCQNYFWHKRQKWHRKRANAPLL